MPFTLSHPAAVLPLGKYSKSFSMTGLVIGSMIPDLEYFVRFKFQSDYSHTLAGIFWADLPAGILLTFVFHYIIKRNLIMALPAAVSGRLTALRESEWKDYFFKNYFKVCISIITGVFTHLFLDNFTHKYGWFVLQIPFLSDYFTLFETKVHFYKILQYTLGIAGLIYGGWFIGKMPLEKAVIPKRGYKAIYWTSVIFISLFTLLIRFKSGLKLVQPHSIALTAISGFIIGIILMGFFKFRENKNTKAEEIQ